MPNLHPGANLSARERVSFQVLSSATPAAASHGPLVTPRSSRVTVTRCSHALQWSARLWLCAQCMRGLKVGRCVPKPPLPHCSPTELAPPSPDPPSVPLQNKLLIHLCGGRKACICVCMPRETRQCLRNYCTTHRTPPTDTAMSFEISEACPSSAAFFGFMGVTAAVAFCSAWLRELPSPAQTPH